MPAVHGKLRRDDSRFGAVAFFEDFQQIVPGSGVERLQAPIVQDKKVGAAEGAHEARMHRRHAPGPLSESRGTLVEDRLLSRQALLPSAEANQLLPTPVGPTRAKLHAP